MARAARSQALAKPAGNLSLLQRLAADQAGTRPHPLLGGPIQPVTASDAIDDHDIRVGVVVGLQLDFLLGRSVELLAEAGKARGAERLALIEKAQRYTEQARRQATGAV